FGRPELMAACFGLLSLHLSISARRSVGTRATLAAAGCLAAFGLAVLSKESAVSLLAGIVLIDWLYASGEARPSPTGLAATLRVGGGLYLGLALVVAACIGARVWAIGDQVIPPVPFVDNPLGALPAGWRVVNAALISLRYGGLLLFPRTLCSDYSYDAIPLVIDPSNAALWMGLPLLALGLAAFVWSYRRDREIFFGLAFLALSFAAASNLLLPIGTILGERLLYLPSAGFCVAAVRSLQRLAAVLPLPGAHRGAAVAAVVVLAAGLHGIRAAQRNPVWANDETLRLHDVAVEPRSVKLQSNAGAAYLERGEPGRALAHFEAAMVPPIGPAIFLNPYQGKVRALVDLGRFEEAGALYQEVIRYGPRSPEIEQQLAEAARASRPSASPSSD
ncbi:MAG: protein O-mannosyl-transferase TMTC1-related protein, partial [Myxococcota bacterium]